MSGAGKVAIVTGVSSGLGHRLAIRLIDDNWQVVGVSRHEPTSEEWSKRANAGKANYIVGDVSDPVTVDKTFALVAQLGNLKLLLNCAGQGVFGPAGKYSPRDIRDVLSGNLIGTILFADRAFEVMKANGGDIVNIMSTAAHVGRVNESIYCASKWGARGYTEALRAEAKGSQVRIIGVYPGGMRTEFWANARGTNTDSSKFMIVDEVAETVLVALNAKPSCYVSDLIINRP